MSDAFEVVLADAVVFRLNDPARGWSQPFEAERTWFPWYEPAELKTLRVAVVPLTLDDTTVSRQPRSRCDYGIGVSLQQAVTVTRRPGNEEIDALTRLAEQVWDYFGSAPVVLTVPAADVGAGNWRVTEAKRAQIYDPERLYHEQVWETFVDLTVRGLR